MSTSDEAETGGGAVTTTGGKVVSSGRDAGGVSGGFGDGSCADTSRASDTPARSAAATSEQRKDERQARMNIDAKVIPHDHGPIQYIPRSWVRNGRSASPSRCRRG